MTEETIVLTKQEFDSLPEYSCSIPTGTTIGKKWKMNRFAFVKFEDGIKREEWHLCEYVEHADPKLVGISYKSIVAILKLKDLGKCLECKSRPATTDYNGKGHYVCKTCNQKMNNYFDNEYK